MQSGWFGRPENAINKIDEFVPKDGNEITKITVAHGAVVNALAFKTTDNQEKKYPAEYGGTAGENNTPFEIKSPFEFITGISGTFNDKGIETLRFHTNDARRELVTFGSTNPTGEPFEFRDEVIVGFKIGHWKTIQSLKVISKSLSQGEPIRDGPWGGKYGASEYDIVFDNEGNGITRINLSHSPGVIHSVIINGNKFGGGGGTKLPQVTKFGIIYINSFTLFFI